MTSRARREATVELARLVRTPESGAGNIGEFLAAHAELLAPVLQIPEAELQEAGSRTDEQLACRLRERLHRLRAREQDEDRARRRERSLAAAERLGTTARGSECGAALDTELLFGELLADRQVKFVSFQSPGAFCTTVARQTLADTAVLRRLHADLSARVDAEGLHVRWKGGRGGYNWISRPPPAGAQSIVLTVPLRVRGRAIRVRGDGGWIGSALRDLGYST